MICLLFTLIFLINLSLCRRGDQRQVSVQKVKSEVYTKNRKKSLTSFTFSEEAKEVLQDLFTQYPPDDRDLGKEILGIRSGKTEKIRERRSDDMFYKPSMKKAEIARKVESLASSIEMVPDLRQVMLTEFLSFMFTWLDPLFKDYSLVGFWSELKYLNTSRMMVSVILTFADY